MNSILSGAIGGVITSLALPLTSYMTTRLLNRKCTHLRIEKKIVNEKHGYDTINMRLVNDSWATLKNVIPYIIVRYADEDIREDPNINVYSVQTSDKPLMLSWAKVVDGKNIPEIEINQTEEADLNLFRFHKNLSKAGLLQIASEQGFSNTNPDNSAKGRVLLHLKDDLLFDLLVTSENMAPIRKRYLLNITTMEIVEW
jgi:hypothetical protein